MSTNWSKTAIRLARAGQLALEMDDREAAAELFAAACEAIQIARLAVTLRSDYADEQHNALKE